MYTHLHNFYYIHVVMEACKLLHITNTIMQIGKKDGVVQKAHGSLDISLITERGSPSQIRLACGWLVSRKAYIHTQTHVRTHMYSNINPYDILNEKN